MRSWIESPIYRHNPHPFFLPSDKTVGVAGLELSGRDCSKLGGTATPIINVGDRGYAII